MRITKKHETPTRVGGVLGGGVGLATGLVVALFPLPPSAAGCSPRPPPVGQSSAQSAAHAAAGMSRNDLQGARRIPR